MKASHNPVAKIILHADGLGVPSPDTVRQRAEELAKINGHPEPTEADWLQARAELHGGHPQDGSDGESETTQYVSERDMIATDRGHRAEKFADDTENAVEELVAEGLDEAEHDQMLQASMLEADDVIEPE